MAAPLAVLSKTHHTSSPVERPRRVDASVAIWCPPYRSTSSFRGEPCSRKYATQGQPEEWLLRAPVADRRPLVRVGPDSVSSPRPVRTKCYASVRTPWAPGPPFRTTSSEAGHHGGIGTIRDGGNCINMGPRSRPSHQIFQKCGEECRASCSLSSCVIARGILTANRKSRGVAARHFA